MSYYDMGMRKDGFEGEVIPDEDPWSPRKEMDNLSVMVCNHGRYSLGDGTFENLMGLDRYDFNGYGDIERYVREECDAVAFTWLSLLDHGGLHIYAGSSAHWSDPGGWDSSIVGFAYVTREAMLEAWGSDTEEHRSRAHDAMMSEIEVYDQYLRGDVWGYEITDDNGDVIESVWGFYGDEAARAAMEEALYEAVQDKADRLKAEFQRTQRPLF